MPSASSSSRTRCCSQALCCAASPSRAIAFAAASRASSASARATLAASSATARAALSRSRRVSPLRRLRLRLGAALLGGVARLPRGGGVARLRLRAEPRLRCLERERLDLGVRRGDDRGRGVLRLAERVDGVARAGLGVGGGARRLLELRGGFVQEFAAEQIEGPVVQTRPGERLRALERPHARAQSGGLRLGLAAVRLRVLETRAGLVQSALRRAKRDPQLRDSAVDHRLVYARGERCEQRGVRRQRGRDGRRRTPASQPAVREILFVGGVDVGGDGRRRRLRRADLGVVARARWGGENLRSDVATLSLGRDLRDVVGEARVQAVIPRGGGLAHDGERTEHRVGALAKNSCGGLKLRLGCALFVARVGAVDGVAARAEHRLPVKERSHVGGCQLRLRKGRARVRAGTQSRSDRRSRKIHHTKKWRQNNARISTRDPRRAARDARVLPLTHRFPEFVRPDRGLRIVFAHPADAEAQAVARGHAHRVHSLGRSRGFCRCARAFHVGQPWRRSHLAPCHARTGGCDPQMPTRARESAPA